MKVMNDAFDQTFLILVIYIVRPVSKKRSYDRLHSQTLFYVKSQMKSKKY